MAHDISETNAPRLESLQIHFGANQNSKKVSELIQKEILFFKQMIRLSLVGLSRLKAFLQNVSSIFMGHLVAEKI